MSPFLSKLNQLMPLFMAVVAIFALAQIFGYVGTFLAGSALIAWILRHASEIEWFFATAAAICALLALLSWLRISGRLPVAVTRWKGLMDILDRLTNRRELERRLQERVETVFVDSDVLAKSLKSKVVGQDGICDELATQLRRRLALQQRGKPVGVFLLAGPPGSGKTYLGKVLAEALGRKLVHFDMTRGRQGLRRLEHLWKADRCFAGHAERRHPPRRIRESACRRS
jgi:ATP-dependent Clp protease ATP-binding subunit ClpE